MKVLSELSQQWDKLLSTEHLHNYVIALAMFAVGLVLARLLSKGVERFMRQQGSSHGAVVGAKLVFYVVLLVGSFAALSQLGVKLTGLLTAAGIFTVALGFAAQTSISNVISGVFLLIDRPFSIDDTVKIDQIIGTVISVDLLSTKVRTFDNLVVRVPNETLLKSTITNYTLFNVRRIDIPVGVAYATDLRQAQTVLYDVLRQHPHVLDEPKPAVLTDLLGDSSINLIIRAWVVRTEFVTARSELTVAIKEALDQAGIEIPFPQRVMHFPHAAKQPDSAPETSPLEAAQGHVE